MSVKVRGGGGWLGGGRSGSAKGLNSANVA